MSAFTGNNSSASSIAAWCQSSTRQKIQSTIINDNSTGFYNLFTIPFPLYVALTVEILYMFTQLTICSLSVHRLPSATDSQTTGQWNSPHTHTQTGLCLQCTRTSLLASRTKPARHDGRDDRMTKPLTPTPVSLHGFRTPPPSFSHRTLWVEPHFYRL